MFCQNGRTDPAHFASEISVGLAYPILCFQGIQVAPKIDTPFGIFFFKTSDLKHFRHGPLIVVASVVNSRPTTVVSLSHRPSIFVYSTISVKQDVARVSLQQSRVVRNS